jgi:hypothetical protein
MAITAKTARYIRLDNKGLEIGALEFGEVRLASSDVPEELAQEGDIDKIARHLVQLGHEPATAFYEARNAKDFYGVGSDCLWVTFERDHLWWTFASAQVLHMMNDVVLTDERVRPSIGGWRNTDINGIPLRAENLSRKVTGLVDRPGAGPDDDTLVELLRAINGRDVSRKAEDEPAIPTSTGADSPARTKGSNFLHEPPALFTVNDVIRTPSAAPDKAGIYTWWFDELPNVPLEDAVEQDGFHLAYVGIASNRPGSRRTLRQRLRNHCNGPIATSTLRRSLAAILVDVLDLHAFSGLGKKIKISDDEEVRLTAWLAAHGRIAWIVEAEPWTYEAELLKNGPPLALNIQGNSHPFVRQLLKLRQQLPNGS